MRESVSGPASFNGQQPTMARISSVIFDRHERPRRATFMTRRGAVKVEWRDVCGDRCCFTRGLLDAKKLASPAIERIKRMVAGP
jgi:hypothetical protein